MQNYYIQDHEAESNNTEGGGASSLVSRNITVSGRRTSVRLEPEMWEGLREVSKREKCTMHDICTLIEKRKKEKTSLTAAIRVFVMLYFRAATTEEGHRRAGHGCFSAMAARARVAENRTASVKEGMRKMESSSANYNKKH